MSVSQITSASTIQAEIQAPVHKTTVSESSTLPQPAYTVSLSTAAVKSGAGDVDHDGDSH